MERDQAWDLIHERLRAGGRVGPPTLDPATRRWTVAAIGPTVGGRRGPAPLAIIGVGADKLEALRDLGERLAPGGSVPRIRTP